MPFVQCAALLRSGGWQVLQERFVRLERSSEVVHRCRCDGVRWRPHQWRKKLGPELLESALCQVTPHAASLWCRCERNHHLRHEVTYPECQEERGRQERVS